MDHRTHPALSRRSTWLLAIGTLGLFVAASPVRAAEPEERTFAVSIDGKPAGSYRMSIRANADGTLTMTGSAEVALKRLAITVYRYTYRGTETWKDGKLQRLDSTANDDGKAYTLSVVPAGAQGLRVTVNGQGRTAPADAWLTTYWHLPPAAQRNQAVPLIDADNGRPLNARLEYIGPAKVTVAGQALDCGRYRLRGAGVQAELWYDAQERLVRQEGVEEGHRTVLELMRVQR